MKAGQSKNGAWLLAVVVVAAGPTTAILHEVGALPHVSSIGLWQIGFIGIAATAGLAAGVWLARRRSRVAGALAVVANAVVLVLYGFLLLFFGLGGSR